jgi:serine/threonine protein kinase
MLNAVESIHDNYVMHRDLKPANIVLDNREVINLKIIDFGSAKEIKWNKNIPLTNEVGTLYYRAPELLDGSTFYTKAIDLWAVGCIFY